MTLTRVDKYCLLSVSHSVGTPLVGVVSGRGHRWSGQRRLPSYWTHTYMMINANSVRRQAIGSAEMLL
jgi:hypothetical protein